MHCGSQFAIGSAELFKKHVAEGDVGGSNVDRIHEFLNVVIHRFLRFEITLEGDLDAG